MIIRAAFFIGLILLLVPHEPDLGLGRPGAAMVLPSPGSVLSAAGLPSMGQVCGSCAGIALPPLSALHPHMNMQLGGRSLADIKAEIETAIQDRRAGRNS